MVNVVLIAEISKFPRPSIGFVMYHVELSSWLLHEFSKLYGRWRRGGMSPWPSTAAGLSTGSSLNNEIDTRPVHL